MSVETRKVLDMVAEGKITAEDAEKLLAKLEASSGAEQTAPEVAPPTEKTGFRRVRFLRIEVDEPGRKQVNIRMPLAFAFAGRSLLGVLPVNVTEKLRERGIDLEQLRTSNRMSDDEKRTLFEQLNIQVDKGDGKKVRIFCE
jgi:SHOCT-like protein